MKITCQACGAKYTIADDKVRGRKVKIRCKGCSAPIVVDAQSEAPPADVPVDTAGQSAAPPAESWSVNLSETDQRTMTTEEIIAGYNSGLVTSDAFVWKEGMSDWMALFDCAELVPLLGAAPAPAAAPAAAAPAAAASPFFPSTAAAASPFFPTASASPKPAAAGAKRSGGRAGSVDLFGGVQRAGSEEEEIATSVPQGHHALPTAAGSTAYGDDKMTGQRNENSVLFSLDSLKAGLAEVPKLAGSSPKKAAPAPRRAGASAPQQKSDPFGMGGQNDLMNLGGGGNPLFSMGANQALLTAPAPPDPPPPRSIDLGLAGPMSMSASAPKKSKGLIIGAAIAVVGLIVIGAVAMGGGDKDKAEGETPSATAETAAATEAPKSEEKKEEPKPTEPSKTEASPAPSAGPAGKPAGEQPKSAAPGPVAGLGPKPAPKEKEEAAAPTTMPGTMPGTGAGPFSISAAQAALGSAAGSAGSCKKPGGPTGSGKVQVTFAPSGRVTSANVAGSPFAGTPVGGCVAGIFRRAKVPPFSGNPVTVSKSFSIN